MLFILGIKSCGVTLRKIWWGGGFPKPSPYLWPNSVIFPTLFMTRPKIWYPVYDRCSWHSCPWHNFSRAFAYGLINNDEKVASSKQHTQFKSRVQKPYPIYDQNSWKTIPFGAAHTYIAHTREYLRRPRIKSLKYLHTIIPRQGP